MMEEFKLILLSYLLTILFIGHCHCESDEENGGVVHSRGTHTRDKIGSFIEPPPYLGVFWRTSAIDFELDREGNLIKKEYSLDMFHAGNFIRINDEEGIVSNRTIFALRSDSKEYQADDMIYKVLNKVIDSLTESLGIENLKRVGLLPQQLAGAADAIRFKKASQVLWPAPREVDNGVYDHGKISYKVIDVEIVSQVNKEFVKVKLPDLKGKPFARPQFTDLPADQYGENCQLLAYSGSLDDRSHRKLGGMRKFKSIPVKVSNCRDGTCTMQSTSGKDHIDCIGLQNGAAPVVCGADQKITFLVHTRIYKQQRFFQCEHGEELTATHVAKIMSYLS